MTALLVVLGAAVGAPLRFWADRTARRMLGTSTAGTLSVNLLGSVLLGLIVALAADGSGPTWLLPFLGVGLCGALTTFSTLALEVVELIEMERVGAATAYLVLSLVLGLAAAAVGYAVGGALG